MYLLKELDHMIREVAKFRNCPFVSWRTRKAGGDSVRVSNLRTGRADVRGQKETCGPTEAEIVLPFCSIWALNGLGPHW